MLSLFPYITSSHSTWYIGRSWLRAPAIPFPTFYISWSSKGVTEMERGLGGEHFKECNGRQPRETETGYGTRSAQHQASQTQQGWAGAMKSRLSLRNFGNWWLWGRKRSRCSSEMWSVKATHSPVDGPIPMHSVNSWGVDESERKDGREMGWGVIGMEKMGGMDLIKTYMYVWNVQEEKS